MFNALTGSNQFVGNWPGVTVEKKEGRLTVSYTHLDVYKRQDPYGTDPQGMCRRVVIKFVADGIDKI